MNHLKYDDDALDENGILKSGKSVRVPLWMADAAASPGVSFTDADERSMADAYSRGVADINAWRGGTPARSQTNHGTFAPMHADRVATTDAIDRAQAHADASYARSVAALNPAARSRVSDTEAAILQDEAYDKASADLNAWRSR